MAKKCADKMASSGVFGHCNKGENIAMSYGYVSLPVLLLQRTLINRFLNPNSNTMILGQDGG